MSYGSPSQPFWMPADCATEARTLRAGRRLRVLYHLDVLTYGGLEKKVMNLALGLDRNRFEPIVSWHSAWSELGDRLQAAGIAVPRLQLNDRDIAQMAGRIRRLGADVFHSFSCLKNDADVRTASLAGVPAIVTNRSNVRHWDPRKRVQEWELDRNHASHAITASCNAVAWVCRNVERAPFSKIAVIYNGVEIPSFTENGAPPDNNIRHELGLAPDTALLGYVANYRAVKGHAGLLRAMRGVLRARPNTHLVCCGADPYGEGQALPQLIARLGLGQNVSLLGSRADVGSVYRGLDLYVHASRSEALSNAILEAMAHGLPVVATAVGGTAEGVEQGVTGYLVPPDDEDALRDALLQALANPEELRRMGRAGRERAERRFSLAAMVEAYSRFYEQLVLR